MSRLKLIVHVKPTAIVERYEAPLGALRMRSRYSHADCEVIVYKERGVYMTSARKYELDRVVMLALVANGLSVAGLTYTKDKGQRKKSKQQVESEARTMNMFEGGQNGD
jgi:hypothetical protein